MGRDIASLLAITERAMPGQAGCVVTNVVKSRQYKSVPENFHVISQLRFDILTETQKRCDLFNLQVVLHFVKRM